MKYALELDEGDRQMVVLALAHLSVERPGWDHALNLLALQIDNQSEGRGVMFDELRKLHRLAVVAERKQWTQPCLACGGPRAEHDSSPRCEGFRDS